MFVGCLSPPQAYRALNKPLHNLFIQFLKHGFAKRSLAAQKYVKAKKGPVPKQNHKNLMDWPNVSWENYCPQGQLRASRGAGLWHRGGWGRASAPGHGGVKTACAPGVLLAHQEHGVFSESRLLLGPGCQPHFPSLGWGEGRKESFSRGPAPLS